jgi:hypothetical protein
VENSGNEGLAGCGEECGVGGVVGCGGMNLYLHDGSGGIRHEDLQDVGVLDEFRMQVVGAVFVAVGGPGP